MTHDRLGRPLIGPCLVWTGKLPKDGYPRLTRIHIWSSPQLVHRVAYAMANGIPLKDLKSVPGLDHLCRTPACSAATHLEPVPQAENNRRGDGNQNVGKTECIKGHPFDAANTIQRKGGNRGCRTCKAEQTRDSWRRKHRPDLVGAPPMSYADAGRIGLDHRYRYGLAIHTASASTASPATMHSTDTISAPRSSGLTPGASAP